MPLVCILMHVFRVYVHTARALCCMFGQKGNARALKSGTATLQSRFLYY